MTNYVAVSWCQYGTMAVLVPFKIAGASDCRSISKLNSVLNPLLFPQPVMLTDMWGPNLDFSTIFCSSKMLLKWCVCWNVFLEMFMCPPKGLCDYT